MQIARGFCLSILPLALVAGCATHAVDNAYGSAYRQMLETQVYDPSTLSTGLGNRAIESVDPTIANGAIEGMRKDEGARTAVSSAGAVSVSQQGSGGGGAGGGGASSGGGMSNGGQ